MKTKKHLEQPGTVAVRKDGGRWDAQRQREYMRWYYATRTKPFADARRAEKAASSIEVWLPSLSELVGKPVSWCRRVHHRELGPTLAFNCAWLWLLAKKLEINERLKRYKRSYRVRPGFKERERIYSQTYYLKKGDERRAANLRYHRAKRADPLYRLRRCLRQRILTAFNRARIQKTGHTLTLVGCSVSELLAHLERNFQPGMTWKNHGRGPGKWHIDHRISLASAGPALRKPEVQRLLCHWSNLQPMWEEENLRKHDDITEEHQFPLLIGLAPTPKKLKRRRKARAPPD